MSSVLLGDNFRPFSARKLIVKSMTQASIFIHGTLLSCAIRSYMSSRMIRMISKLGFVSKFRRLAFLDVFQQSSMLVPFSPIHNFHIRHQESNKWMQSRRSSSGADWGGDGERQRQRFPIKLMDFPQITIPSLVKSFRNRFFSFLIRGYYDTSFTLDGFLEAASQAAVYISTCISRGDFAKLKGLVVDEAIQEIQNNYADLNYQQRRWLQIIPSEIIGKFVYEIGMMFDDDTDKRFVEITIVLHCYHDLDKTEVSISDLYTGIGENPEKFYVCNYRFIREFTKGVEDSWTINKLNHFLPFVQRDE